MQSLTNKNVRVLRYVFSYSLNLKNIKKKFLKIFLIFSDYLFKFLIIGSAGSGKSCLLHHFIENKCKYFFLLLICLFLFVGVIFFVSEKKLFLFFHSQRNDRFYETQYPCLYQSLYFLIQNT